MTTLVVGASGATGRLLVGQLLERGEQVRVIVRSAERLPEAVRTADRVSVFEADLLDLSEADLAARVEGCRAVASCLGHNLTFKGIFGPPRRLVTDAMRRLCEVARRVHPPEPIRFVLMNTAGNRNRDLAEPVSTGERAVLHLLRLLVPPHADNERAAEYLRAHIVSDDPQIEWAAVRPDTLFDEDRVTPYTVHPSPTRSAIFNAGRTSRINVAHFMASLITDDDIWREWKGRMPVVYNRTDQHSGRRNA